jgi:DNA-binding Xre family transcriptional regulator
MNIPDKNAIATEIRRIMGEKQIKSIDLAEALRVTQATIVAVRNGSASYELLKRAIDTIDNWEEAK